MSCQINREILREAKAELEGHVGTRSERTVNTCDILPMTYYRGLLKASCLSNTKLWYSPYC
jgi:hypothetical protein